MKAWWTARTPRERLVIGAGAAVLVMFAVAELAVAPVLEWRDRAAARAASAEDRYRLVARSAALATPVPSQGAEPARNVLNEAAGALGVELTFVNALPDGSVDMQAGPVAPERLFELLSRLEREHGVKVKSADISRADGGLVRVQATFGR